MRVVVTDSQLSNGVYCPMIIKTIYTVTGGATYSFSQFLQYRIEGDDTTYVIGYQDNPPLFNISNIYRTSAIDVDLKVIYAKTLVSTNNIFIEIELDEKNLVTFVNQLTTPNLSLQAWSLNAAILRLLFAIAEATAIISMKNVSSYSVPAGGSVTITLQQLTRFVYLFDTSITNFSSIGFLRLLYNNIQVPINPNILYPMGNQNITIYNSDTTAHTIIVVEF